MKTINKILIAICLTIGLQLSSVQAQEIKGYVYELVSSNPLWNTTIKNLRTQQIVQSDRDGSFKISGQLNDYLVFSNPGYKQDTIFYYEDNIRRVYMTRDESLILIDEVVVSRMTDSRLAAEIAKAQNEGKAVDVSQQRGGLRVSPSRLFGKKAKEARSNLNLLVAEQEKREIDRRFTTQLIATTIPLSPDEIALFRERFRPTLDFTKKASNEDLKLYILDSYKKFKSDK
ncbi:MULTISPECIES: carboxypeptidase-like regulatory domain-containing protein [Sphingobacterium]|uniref:carboxypeptidase-like regulatory domain-containing protein n=1 Tax=Sphingobacterium TaxID=28453 RepID=UPI0013D99D0F|nr:MULTISPECIES: carboxypeptidase-like regulatory domain-containing protein [unclassified Sphingobacterium]